MSDETPGDEIEQLQLAAGAVMTDYGPGARVVESFGAYEAEYAMIRKGVGVMDLSQAGAVEARGGERDEFLNRFLTNQVKNLPPGEGRRAFLLSKAGRVQADMLLFPQEDHTLLLLDRADAGQVVAELDKFLFSEDAKLMDASAAWRQVGLHGPAGAPLLAELGMPEAGAMPPLTLRQATLAGKSCRVIRRDETGSPGYRLVIPVSDAQAVFAKIVEILGGLSPAVEGGVRRKITGRGIGWLAYNTARIEAGSALFHIDFGPDSLPHETGVLAEAVSFNKGCYLGQEIVARMQNLGHPKKVLVGLRFEDDRLPIAGSQVLDAAPGKEGTVIGGVTSSAVSPMLGQTAVALAMMKWDKRTAGTKVLAPAEGTNVPATVQGLSFLK